MPETVLKQFGEVGKTVKPAAQQTLDHVENNEFFEDTVPGAKVKFSKTSIASRLFSVDEATSIAKEIEPRVALPSLEEGAQGAFTRCLTNVSPECVTS